MIIVTASCKVKNPAQGNTISFTGLPHSRTTLFLHLFVLAKHIHIYICAREATWPVKTLRASLRVFQWLVI